MFQLGKLSLGLHLASFRSQLCQQMLVFLRNGRDINALELAAIPIEALTCVCRVAKGLGINVLSEVVLGLVCLAGKILAVEGAVGVRWFF